MTPSATRSPRSMPAPTTTSPSRSGWASCSRVRAALRRSAPATEAAVVVTDAFTIDLAAKRVTNGDGEVRLTPTEWHLVEMLVRNAGKLVTQGALLREVWGPGIRDRDQLPACLHGAYPAQARTRRRAPAVLHHRTRDGLPIRGSLGLARLRPPTVQERSGREEETRVIGIGVRGVEARERVLGDVRVRDAMPPGLPVRS